MNELDKLLLETKDGVIIVMGASQGVGKSYLASEILKQFEDEEVKPEEIVAYALDTEDNTFIANELNEDGSIKQDITHLIATDRKKKKLSKAQQMLQDAKIRRIKNSKKKGKKRK